VVVVVVVVGGAVEEEEEDDDDDDDETRVGGEGGRTEEDVVVDKDEVSSSFAFLLEISVLVSDARFMLTSNVAGLKMFMEKKCLENGFLRTYYFFFLSFAVDLDL